MFNNVMKRVSVAGIKSVSKIHLNRQMKSLVIASRVFWLFMMYFHMHIHFRNNCEMTHFFFSLIREPLEDEKLMPLVFYFDTHIITQVNLNVKHTFFDKVFFTYKYHFKFCGNTFYLLFF